MTDGPIPKLKTIATIALLTTWEIWNERNTRFFHNKKAPTFVIFSNIEKEARLWETAGAKCLGEIMPREKAYVMLVTLLSCKLLN